MLKRMFRSAIARRALLIAGLASLSASTARPNESDHPFIPQLVISSTIPGNGDLNPYGAAFVPKQFPRGGAIASGDVLVSNFNNSGNLQGTGVTIIKLTPNGTIAPPVAPGANGNATTFFTSKLAGLDTALGVLRGGFVLVGNLPTKDGTFGTIGQGSLQVVDRNGNWVMTLNDKTFLDSPWDLAINDDGVRAQVFVSNVLSGTVSRLDIGVGPMGVAVLQQRMIANGYAHEQNAAALVLGPTGLAYDREADKLYVASTADNAIYAVPMAGRATSPVNKGALVFTDPHLRGPLALAFAPNEHLLTANGDAVNGDPTHPSEIVEFTKSGKFVQEFNVDAGQGEPSGSRSSSPPDANFNFAAVDDLPNTVAVYGAPRSSADGSETSAAAKR